MGTHRTFSQASVRGRVELFHKSHASALQSAIPCMISCIQVCHFNAFGVSYERLWFLFPESFIAAPCNKIILHLALANIFMPSVCHSDGLRTSFLYPIYLPYIFGTVQGAKRNICVNSVAVILGLLSM